MEQDKSFKSLWNEIMETDAPNNLEIIDSVVEYIMLAKGLVEEVDNGTDVFLSERSQEIYCHYFDYVEALMIELMDLDI